MERNQTCTEFGVVVKKLPEELIQSYMIIAGKDRKERFILAYQKNREGYDESIKASFNDGVEGIIIMKRGDKIIIPESDYPPSCKEETLAYRIRRLDFKVQSKIIGALSPEARNLYARILA